MSWFLSLGRVPLMVTSRGGSAALSVHLIHPRPHFFSHFSSPFSQSSLGWSYCTWQDSSFFSLVVSLVTTAVSPLVASFCFVFPHRPDKPSVEVQTALRNRNRQLPTKLAPPFSSSAKSVSGGTSRKQVQLTLRVTLRPIPRVPQQARPQSLTRLNT